MGSKGSEKDLVVTQISVGGFNNDVNAKLLSEYLEEQFGQVWRCRLKTSSTPPDSYPVYDIDVEKVRRINNYVKVEPHAFVHFASSDSAQYALAAARRGEIFLEGKLLKVSLGRANPFNMNKRRRTFMPYKFSDVNVEIGALFSNDDFVVGWRGPHTGVNFFVDPFNDTCKILFTRDTAFRFKGEGKYAVIKCNFKIEFLLREINEIKECKDFASLALLLQLASSPLVYYRTAADDIEESVAFNLLDDDDEWIRTTDITCSGAIGRFNTYRISIRPRNGPSFQKAMTYFRESRVRVVEQGYGQRLRTRDEPDFGVPVSESFFCFQNHEGISFKVLFLVNAVLHKGIVNQYQMTAEFFSLLREHQEGVNLAALKHIFSYKRPVNNAIQMLARVQKWLFNNPNLLKKTAELDDVVEVRMLVITPTKAYCLPPTVELSNRVLRKYKHVSDRFLRVTFMDEGMSNLNRKVLTYYAANIVREITASSNPQRTAIFQRVKSILNDGFYLCGRRYSFLAFSANQLRDRSAWFFAEAPEIRVPGIINWMGKFGNRNVAKCAARMGQCFSSTYATVEVLPSEVNSEFPDVERNGYVFSDGIGMMSADLSMEVAEKLQLSANPPCAYQIRYAGCKGVVACWPAKNDGIRLSLRPSMKKFDSNHTILEICSWTRLQPGFLNRQIITLLSSLDVKDEIFWEMQKEMLSRLDKILVDSDVAFDIVTASCAEAGNTAAIMLSSGFKPQSEPHLRGMLASIRTAQLGDLRNKARIFVPSGRWLMGCMDELGELEQGQCFIQVSSPSLESCFVKHGPKFSDIKKNLQVIKGLVVIAKNPCLHPGDVRILEAVDIPGLHHLYDCLVFPQKGDRPHPDEASGSDLDGDLYFVTWDENLIPPSKKSWMPMNYEPAVEKKLGRQVKIKDIIDFFSKNMVQESLGEICNAHVVHADLSEFGAMDEKCLKLAELAALAVDFPKTGKLVTMPFDLKPKMYPDFMGKEEFQSYKSEKILGKLFRQVKDVYDAEGGDSSGLEHAPENIPYDTNLEIPGYEDFIDDAWKYKCSYDGQLNGLLGQYKVNGEEEVVTGHIWSMPKYSSKKQGELKERLKLAYHTLRKEFRNVFEQMEPDFDLLPIDEKNDIYERKASAWYRVTYHPHWVTRSLELQLPDAVSNSVMLSFAWIAADYLARIKIRQRGMQHSDSTKPINSLGSLILISDMANGDVEEPLLGGNVNSSIRFSEINSFKRRRPQSRSTCCTTSHTQTNAEESLHHPEFISTKSFRLRDVLLFLAVYIGFGAICFFIISDQIEGKKTNGILDAVYLCIVTMTAVGYGDLVPKSNLAKVLACVFVFTGMAFVGFVLSKAADSFLERQQILFLKAIKMRKDCSTSSAEVETNVEKYKLLSTLALLAVLTLLGTIFLCQVEDLSLFDAFYCVCATITTLGYGDKSFSTKWGRLFASFWILMSTICLGQLFYSLAELYTEQRRKSMFRWALTHELTNSDLQAADLDHDSEVSAAEFIVYKLKELGKITDEDISLVMESFKLLDVDHSGTLTENDIALLQSSSRSKS